MKLLSSIFLIFIFNLAHASECNLDNGAVTLYQDKNIKFVHTSKFIEGLPSFPVDELIKIEVKKDFFLQSNPSLKKVSEDQKFLQKTLAQGKEIQLKKSDTQNSKKIRYRVIKKVIGDLNFSFTTAINVENEREMSLISNDYSHGFIQTTINLKKHELPDGGSKVTIRAVSYLKKSTYDALKNKLPYKLLTFGNPIHFIKKEVVGQLKLIGKELEEY